tara:strand:- start:4931 stop:5620 length:690 start_codon:yes stop_codon:yes gene_type:complete
MREYTKELLARAVLRLTDGEEWNHQFFLPFDIKTRKKDVDSPGYNINKWKRIEKIIDSIGIKDKSVIDVGCSDGYFSTQCALAGAAHVYGIDLDPLRIKRAKFIKSVFKMQNVEFEIQNLYSLKEGKKFDILLGLGLIHRVPDLDGCLQKLSKIANNIILEFKSLNDDRPICENKNGVTKSNIYNALYNIPTHNYIINEMKKNGINNYKLYEDNISNLKYKRSLMVFSK